MTRALSQKIIYTICLSFIGFIALSQTDQNLIYASFLGGNVNENARQIEIMADGSYVLLCNTGSVNLPVSDNAEQSYYAGSGDAYLARFSEENQLIYATYFGGNSTDSGLSLTSKSDGGFILVGGTSSPDFTVTPGAQQQEFSQVMGYVASFDENNALIWSTFVGGSGIDRVYDVKEGIGGNIYVVGTTSSDGLATPGVFQENLSPEVETSFIAKFSEAGQLVWLSYFAGENAGILFPLLAISPDDDQIYLSAYTIFDGIPMLNSFQENYGGGRDGILAAFNAETGALNWSTYYGGSNDDDIRSISVNPEGTIFIIGETSSDNNISSAGAHQEFRGGFTDHYLTAFNSDGQRLWSTYFGGEFSEEYLVDLSLTSDDILLTGYSDSPNNIAEGNPYESDNSITAGSPEIDGGYIARFDQESGNLIWGTYFLSSCTGGFPVTVEAINNSKFMIAAIMNGNCAGQMTDDAFQSNHGGLLDMAVFIFEDATITSTKNPEILPLTVYPNPTRDAVRVEIPGQLFAPMALQVYDVAGRLVVQKATFQSGNFLDVSNLSPAIYVLQGIANERVFRAKIVIEK